MAEQAKIAGPEQQAPPPRVFHSGTFGDRCARRLATHSVSPQPLPHLSTPLHRSKLLPAFNAMLNYCARSGAIEEAVHILHLMRDHGDEGLAPDVTSFNTVMAGLASAGRHTRAAFLLAEMKSCGLEADSITFATLIHACAEAGNWTAAEVGGFCHQGGSCHGAVAKPKCARC